jgi:Leucine-rich repeat (LRR) protein
MNILSKTPNRLLTLDLAYNQIGREGAIKLVDNFDTLTYLDIGENNIDSEGITHIANSEHLVNLKTLNLQGNEIGDEGCIELANCSFNKITALDISHNFINERGIEALPKGESLKHLTRLDVTSNYMSPDLFKRMFKSKLTSLKPKNLIY